jgi:siroheme synthase-like protein
VSGYPIVLEGKKLHALVVGGGDVALRKIRALLDAGARVRVVAPRVAPEVQALGRSHGSLEIITGEYAPSLIGGSLIVIAATDDPVVNATISDDARRAGRLVNVVDAPERGNFVTPAVHRAGDLVIAVVAGGIPAAAARIRDALAARFDGRYAAAIEVLRSLREGALSREPPDRERWRAASAEVVSDRFCESVENGEIASRVDAWR